MNLRTVQLARTFLDRVELKGGEVAAFVEVVNALHAVEQQIKAAIEAANKPAPTPPPAEG